MELEAARTTARQLMDEYQLHTWSFGFDNAKRRCGRCSYAKRLITLSRHYVELNDEREVRDTILHEIAHALTGAGVGHGPKWQATAREIGATPNRCADASVSMPRARWELVCTEGHSFGERHRRHRDITVMHVCGRCRSPLVYLPNV